MAKKKTMHSSKDIDEDDNADAKEFAKLIAHRISTAKVKTASPSRAQQKIQVRIVWTDPDGQHGLGYLSMYASAAEKGSTGPSLKNFIDDVFRIIKWSRDTSRGIYGNDNDWSSFHGEVWRELQKTTCLDATSQVHTLKSRAVHAIVKCAQDGAHKKARREANQAKAKLYIDRSVTFAVNNGLKDDEIRDLIQLAFVKHTMES